MKHRQKYYALIFQHVPSPIPIHSVFSLRDAKSLIKRLLTHDLGKRFGNLKNGAEDIKQHRWFQSLEFTTLLKKEIASPYKPVVKVTLISILTNALSRLFISSFFSLWTTRQISRSTLTQRLSLLLSLALQTRSITGEQTLKS